MGAHVLVVDDDPQVLRMLSEVLGKRGYGVDTAGDGEEAFERALAKAPDLIVTDVMMPKLDGWSLVRKLRLEPKLAGLPVIFLTAVAGDDDRVKAFRLGADDYVNKPFKLNDLVARVEKVLGAKVPVVEKKAASSGLSGDLAQVGLSTLLVLIEMERKTGVLRLTAEDGRAAKMAVREGKVLDARLDDAAEPTGAEAVYLMLTWTAGKFEFSAREVAMEDRIGLATTHLLMEGARLMDEASAPDAEAQLTDDAIAEWQEDERAPIVTAAKLADLVRKNARASLPAYTAFSSPGIKVPAELEPAATEPVTPEPVTPEPVTPIVEVVPVLPAKRASPLLLVLGLVAAAGGAATFAVHAPAATAAAVDVRGDAAAIGAAIDRGADAARMRAGGFASAPLVRTGIETDAATMHDMAANEALLQPGPGEVIEIFQARDGARTSLLRTPDSAPTVDVGAPARVAQSGKAVAVVGTAPIKSQAGADAGVVAVVVTVDLQEVSAALAPRVTSAKLVGLDRPLELVAGTGTEQTVPVIAKAAPGLSLVVATAATASAAALPGWVLPARIGALGLAGVLLALHFMRKRAD